MCRLADDYMEGFDSTMYDTEDGTVEGAGNPRAQLVYMAALRQLTGLGLARKVAHELVFRVVKRSHALASTCASMVVPEPCLFD